jgi:hypothetical protein
MLDAAHDCLTDHQVWNAFARLPSDARSGRAEAANPYRCFAVQTNYMTNRLKMQHLLCKSRALHKTKIRVFSSDWRVMRKIQTVVAQAANL